MTINESFLLSHCCRIRYLCFQWKENKNKKKKQKRKAITTLLNIMTTKYALAFGFQLPEIRYSCLFLLPNHIYRLNGQWCNYCWCQCDHQRCFQRQCTKWWNSSQKRTHRNNFKYTCALHSMTIIWRNKITLLIDRSDFTRFFFCSASKFQQIRLISVSGHCTKFVKLLQA